MPKRILVWFRNDLRLSDHEALFEAAQHADEIIPFYCKDPRQFGQTSLGFQKTGLFRQQFLYESLQQLNHHLQEHHGKLWWAEGHPEQVIPRVMEAWNIDEVYAFAEISTEEQHVQQKLAAQVPVQWFWGSTLVHLQDLPFYVEHLPEVFTSFRKEIEKNLTVRPCLPVPQNLRFLEPPAAHELPWFHQSLVPIDPRSAFPFRGGEFEAQSRMQGYFWEQQHLSEYKQTRNGLMGTDYSSKFSPWLANGSLSPRQVYWEIQKYEQRIVQNESTYWLFFELLWRDYFKWLNLRFGNQIFQKGGIQQKELSTSIDWDLFHTWATGQTAHEFINANMVELQRTGFMSNRGRQNVASYLVHDLGLDWRMGAEYFESYLIDYDPCSNYGNWMYQAGVGTDPRPNRRFNPDRQQRQYDPQAQYIHQWLPQQAKPTLTQLELI